MTSSAEDWEGQDFYAALGVRPDCEAEDISRNYRTLSDVYAPGTDRHEEIERAHAVLSDPATRSRYDQARLVELTSTAVRPTAPPTKSSTAVLDPARPKVRERVIPPREAASATSTAPSTAPSTAEAGGTGTPADRRPAPHWARPAAWGALALALVALVVSLLLWVEAGRAADRRDGTRAATAAARNAVESMLSYDYKTFDQHTKAVDALLTGSFRAEFDKGTTESVKPLAVQNQAVVQARASEVGVMSASDNTVRVLAFVNQSTTSAKLDRPQVDQNRVILTMTKVDGRWLVSKVEAF